MLQTKPKGLFPVSARLLIYFVDRVPYEQFIVNERVLPPASKIYQYNGLLRAGRRRDVIIERSRESHDTQDATRTIGLHNPTIAVSIGNGRRNPSSGNTRTPGLIGKYVVGGQNFVDHPTISRLQIGPQNPLFCYSTTPYEPGVKSETGKLMLTPFRIFSP